LTRSQKDVAVVGCAALAGVLLLISRFGGLALVKLGKAATSAIPGSLLPILAGAVFIASEVFWFAVWRKNSK
jgi:hypothetical protein